MNRSTILVFCGVYIFEIENFIQARPLQFDVDMALFHSSINAPMNKVMNIIDIHVFILFIQIRLLIKRLILQITNYSDYTMLSIFVSNVDIFCTFEMFKRLKHVPYFIWLCYIIFFFGKQEKNSSFWFAGMNYQRWSNAPFDSSFMLIRRGNQLSKGVNTSFGSSFLQITI